MRPPISRVVGMLGGDSEVNNVTTKPSYLTGWDFNDITCTLKNEGLQTSIAANHDSATAVTLSIRTRQYQGQMIYQCPHRCIFRHALNISRLNIRALAK
ncbi:hypothetical protein V6N13_023678 [Hibiscus sabdariffa]